MDIFVFLIEKKRITHFYQGDHENIYNPFQYKKIHLHNEYSIYYFSRGLSLKLMCSNTLGKQIQRQRSKSYYLIFVQIAFQAMDKSMIISTNLIHTNYCGRTSSTLRTIETRYQGISG